MGKLIKTQIIDDLYSRISLYSLSKNFKHLDHKDAFNILSKEFYIWKSYWEKKGNRKIEKKYKYPLIDNFGIFLTGYHKIMTEITNGEYSFYPEGYSPLNYSISENIGSLKLRDYQKEIIKKLLLDQVSGRGVIVANTGLGKTIIAMAISRLFLPSKTVFLVHTRDLMYQTYEEYCSIFGKDRVGLIGDGKCEIGEKSIYICIYKTLWNMIKFSDKETLYPIVSSGVLIVDECHHLNKFKSQYTDVVKSIRARVRVGLTATPFRYEGQNSDEGFFVNEGLLGPQIDIIDSHYLIKEGIMSKPIIKLINTQKNKSLSGLSKYSDIYEEGIVRNRFRNIQIIDEVKRYKLENKSILILVDKIKHGIILSNMLKRDNNIDHIFIQGESESEVRNNAKKDLNKKDIDVIIATTIFKEGIDIPSLDVFINASGGKGETPVIQKIGRALRATDEKKEAIIIDFLDIGKYLAEHSLQRMRYYNERNWL